MSSETVPEYELTDFSPNSSSAVISNTGSSRPKRTPPLNKRKSRYRDVLKHAGLQLPDTLIGRALAWRSSTEHRKVAVYQSRRMAMLNSLPHLVPLCGAITLLVLFWTKHWTGTSDNSKSLQFVAKLHELLMQASIIDVLLCIIRSQALDGSMPLGALSGAVQSRLLSYLWSLDFASALLSPAYDSKRKTVFGVSVLGLLSMTAVVGPSSAVLMIPQIGMPHLNDTLVRQTSIPEGTLYPTRIEPKHGLNFTVASELRDSTQLRSIPHPGRRSVSRVAQSYEPYLDSILRVFSVSEHRYPAMLTDMYTVATGPTLISTANLDIYTSLHDKSIDDYTRLLSDGEYWSVRTWQPLVALACTSHTTNGTATYYYKDDGTQAALLETDKLYDQALRMKQRLNQSFHMFDLWLWIESPEIESSSLLALTWQESASYLELVVCTVSLFWWSTKTKATPTDMGVLVENEGPIDRASMSRQDLRPIDIQINGTPSLYHLALNPPRSSMVPLSMAYALSNLVKDSKDVLWEANPSELDESATRTTFPMEQILHGYGYGSDIMSVRLSVAVITVYCLITTIYIFYMVTTGHTSIAWDSATEIVVLALQSRKADGLGHTSVGLDSMETLRRNVGIRVNTVSIGDTGEVEEKLELVFADDDEEMEQKGFTKIVRNQAY